MKLSFMNHPLKQQKVEKVINNLTNTANHCTMLPAKWVVQVNVITYNQ